MITGIKVARHVDDHWPTLLDINCTDGIWYDWHRWGKIKDPIKALLAAPRMVVPIARVAWAITQVTKLTANLRPVCRDWYGDDLYVCFERDDLQIQILLIYTKEIEAVSLLAG